MAHPKVPMWAGQRADLMAARLAVRSDARWADKQVDRLDAWWADSSAVLMAARRVVRRVVQRVALMVGLSADQMAAYSAGWSAVLMADRLVAR